MSLLRTREAARELGISAGYLHNLRCRGQGPKFVRLGRAVRYRLADLAAYVDERVDDPDGAEKSAA